jgi:hypothetical protein
MFVNRLWRVQFWLNSVRRHSLADEREVRCDFDGLVPRSSFQGNIELETGGLNVERRTGQSGTRVDVVLGQVEEGSRIARAGWVSRRALGGLRHSGINNGSRPTVWPGSGTAKSEFL